MAMRRQTPNLSKDFKKYRQVQVRKQSVGAGTTQLLDASRLSELKIKLEKDRQIVKSSTGRRFKETDARSSNTSFSRKEQQPTKTILSNEKLMRATPKLPSTSVKKTTATSIPPTPNRVSLTQLSTPNSQTASLSSSLAFFDKQKDLQKVRNKEVFDFLKSVHLQQFYDVFIQEGFDDLDTIMEIETEVLNGMRMKASQQKKLFEEIKKRKGEVGVGTGTESRINTGYSTINSRSRIRTEPILERYNGPVILKSPKRPFHQPNRGITTSSLMSSSNSFLYSVGNPTNDLEVTRDRKACCRCFKITYDPVKGGYLYYCSNECAAADSKQSKRSSPNKSKISSQDVRSRQAKTQVPSKQQQEDMDFSELSMSTSMIRDYH